jgi:hypothetical protein
MTQTSNLAVTTEVLKFLVTLLAIPVTFLLYWRRKRHERVSNVVSQFLSMRRTPSSRDKDTYGFATLQKAGVLTLRSNREVREALKRIELHGEKHPHSEHPEEMHSDLLCFFRDAALKSADLTNWEGLAAFTLKRENNNKSPD